MKVIHGWKYSDVFNKPRPKKKKPAKPSFLLRCVVRLASIPDLMATRFQYKKIGMEKLGKREPCLILMNHSSFIDLKIASRLLFPRKYNIVTTSDGLIGRNLLMHHVGCIPTQKFVADLSLIRNMMYAVKTHGSSILMYPEASYSFDGTATPLPESLGRCIQMLKLPVLMIKTEGAFTRDPLYNNLQLRKVKVSATMEYLLSPEELKTMSADEINALLADRFSFDHFKWQKENGVRITEPFRADSLNRVLYKCPHCLSEGQTEGRGTTLTCHACGKVYEMLEDGSMRATVGETEFSHIPDWYRWERECVKREIEEDTYKLDVDVKICAMVDTYGIYDIGEGHLTHDREGFCLTGADGELHYTQKPLASYSLYADYYWYRLGDIICIGNNDILYYCFPMGEGDVVAKTRLAAEEMYKLFHRETRNEK